MRKFLARRLIVRYPSRTMPTISATIFTVVP
jgi:hypothetical protein